MPTEIFDPKECLTGLFSKVRVRRIVVYDLESKDGRTQKPGFTRVFLAGVYDGSRFFSFRNAPSASVFPWERRAIEEGGCIDQAMRMLLSRPFRGAWIFAHNGGGFDHLHILPWLVSHIDEFSFVIIPTQSTIQVMKVTDRKSGHTFTFLDSMKLLPMSLDRAAKAFGFPGKLTHDLNVQEDDSSWESYLKRDCEALHESLTQLQSLINEEMGGELGVTAPSTAMKLYRRRYMGSGQCPDRIPQHRHFRECADDACNACLHDWIRRGYCGGRTEVFRKFGRRLTYYDINSSYPAAMLLPMPGGTIKQYGPSKGPEDFARLERGACGFVECEVYIPTHCYLPPLPIRHPQSKRLIFPTGTIRGVWSWEELKLLSDPMVGGRIVSVVRSIWYQHKTLFFDYVKEMYQHRDKGSPTYNIGLDTLAKLMMNSLYGKFGMNEDRHEIRVLAKGEAAPEGAIFPSFANGEGEDRASRVCIVEVHVTPPYIIPQISAQITALGRVRLWTFMAAVLRLGGRLFYCDTDSLFTDLVDLPTSGELGAMKNVYPGEVIDCEFAGPKAYMMKKEKPFEKEHLSTCVCAQVCRGDHLAEQQHPPCSGCSTVKIAMKGIPRDKRTEEWFLRFMRGERMDFKRLEKLGAMQESGFSVPPKMRSVHKTHLYGAEKRLFSERGDNSLPFHFETGFENQ